MDDPHSDYVEGRTEPEAERVLRQAQARIDQFDDVQQRFLSQARRQVSELHVEATRARAAALETARKAGPSVGGDDVAQEALHQLHQDVNALAEGLAHSFEGLTERIEATDGLAAQIALRAGQTSATHRTPALSGAPSHAGPGRGLQPQGAGPLGSG